MPSYRVEMSISNRATCTETECKKTGVKIEKDVLRFGTWVEVEGYGNGGFKWKHWGCVTGKQLQHLRDSLDPHGTGNYEWDRLDGYDDEGKGGLVHAAHLQEKVRRVVTQGFIDPEDWKGDPEMNKLGEIGIRTAATKKKMREVEKARIAALEGDDQAGPASSPVKDQTPVKAPAKKRARPKDDEDDEETKPAPKQKRATKPKKEEVDDDVKRAPDKKGRKKAVKEESLEETNGLDAVDEVKPKATTKGRKKAVKEEPSDEMNGLAAVDEVKKAPVKKARKNAVKDESVDEEVNYGEAIDPKPKAAAATNARRKAVKEEPVDEEMNDAEQPKPLTKKARKKVIKKEEVKPEVENGIKGDVKGNFFAEMPHSGCVAPELDPNDAPMSDTPAAAEEDYEVEKIKPKKKGGKSKSLNSAAGSDKLVSTRGTRSRTASKN